MISVKKILENMILEYSKNDPIPEITRMKSGLAIFLFGPPASGKSTLVKNFIQTKGNFKVINPDDMSATRKKIPGIINKFHDKNVDLNDPNVYVRGTKDLSIKYIQSIFSDSKQNVIYDTTGNDYENIVNIANFAKDHGYTVIYIHVLATLGQSMASNQMRDRNVDNSYLVKSYKDSQSLIHKFSKSNPNSYYIIANLYGKYKFFKYENGKLLRNRNGKYE